MEKKTFGMWVKEQRALRGWSVRKLAEEAGITHPTIVLVENDNTGATRIMVRKIADALGVPRSEAIKAWLGDEGQEGGAITYVTGEDRIATVERYEGLGPVNRRIAETMIKELYEAERAGSIGRRQEDHDAEDTKPR